MKTPARAHSLRARLVATVLVLLAVTLSVIGVATTLALRQFLYGRLDREVRRGEQPLRRGPDRPARATGRVPLPGHAGEFLGPSRSAHARRDDPRRQVVQRAEVSSRGGGSRAYPSGRRRRSSRVPVGAAPTTVDLSSATTAMVATETAATVYVIGQPAGGAQDVIAPPRRRRGDRDRDRAARWRVRRRRAGAPRAAAPGAGGRHGGQGQRAAAGPRRGGAGRAGAATSTRAPRSGRSRAR